jgi:hypothetical protein
MNEETKFYNIRELERLQKQADKNPDCSYCQAVALRGDASAPPHHVYDFCESGKQPHCTCPLCFG